jgi:peptidoglycan L-alanyl-D-glutamate endopeptidase CwlK
MYKWGKASKDRLATCDKRLQEMANMMLARSEFDLTITCGHRTEKEQNEAFEKGTSRAKFGQSKHNTFPSKAIDIVPLPLNWDVKDRRWQEMALNAMWCAGKLGFEITWGGSFKKFFDMPHIEIKEK